MGYPLEKGSFDQLERDTAGCDHRKRKTTYNRKEKIYKKFDFCC